MIVCVALVGLSFIVLCREMYLLGEKKAYNDIAKNYIVFHKHTVIKTVSMEDKNEKTKSKRVSKKTSKKTR